MFGAAGLVAAALRGHASHYGRWAVAGHLQGTLPCTLQVEGLRGLHTSETPLRQTLEQMVPQEQVRINTWAGLRHQLMGVSVS